MASSKVEILQIMRYFRYESRNIKNVLQVRPDICWI